jgi:DNA-binding NtrC family response regulator
VSRNPRTILLVHESGCGMPLRQLTLESMGYRVVGATRPDVVLNMLKFSPIDVVVMDHRADRESNSFTAKIKQVRPNVPVVICLKNEGSSGTKVDAVVMNASGPDGLRKAIESVIVEHCAR